MIYFCDHDEYIRPSKYARLDNGRIQTTHPFLRPFVPALSVTFPVPAPVPAPEPAPAPAQRSKRERAIYFCDHDEFIRPSKYARLDNGRIQTTHPFLWPFVVAPTTPAQAQPAMQLEPPTVPASVSPVSPTLPRLLSLDDEEESLDPLQQEDQEPPPTPHSLLSPPPPPLPFPLPSPQQLRRSARIAAIAALPLSRAPVLPILRRSPRLALVPRISYVGMC